MHRYSANTTGAIYMMLSMAGFVLNDAMMKLVFAQLGLFQAITLRGAMAFVLMFLLCWLSGGLRLSRGIGETIGQKMLILRTIGEVGGTFFFLTALQHMPIANVTAVLQVLPLTITFAAALFLGEKVGWRRYGAIAVGFVGVLFILKPGTSDFNFFAIYALIATGFITMRDLATRQMPDFVPSTFISLITAGAVLGFGLLGSLTETWVAVGPASWGLLAGAASILMCGYLFSILAMRHGEVSFVAPFRYSILLWALLIGAFVFDEIPDAWALFGAALVVGSGLFSFHRERLLARKLAISTASSAASSLSQ